MVSYFRKRNLVWCLKHSVHKHGILSGLSIRYCNRINLTISLQKTEYGDFTGSTATAFAFALSAKITFICFYFAINISKCGLF
ncbi:hypothetical protein F9Z36_1578 [Neisseria gonorrhoeae]|nr:hypothetical protein F9Z36_1578 [Neisseria gonorrhoeae]